MTTPGSFGEERFTLLDSDQQLSNATIMIVDDESTTMDVVQAFLEDAGYKKFLLVENPALAMNVLEEKRPDILLLDLMMPEVSGFDILTAIRMHPKFKFLPVIIFTSSSDTPSKIRALELGATDFLSKPLDKSELGLRVRNNLAAKAYHDQLAYYDPLTRLPNRQLFLECLDWSLKKAKRFSEHVALLTIALDDFNKIDAAIGPGAEDEVLKEVARRIAGEIRSVDVIGSLSKDEETGVNLFRTGGSSFSLILDRLHNEESAALVAERLIQIIKYPIRLDTIDIHVTSSIGIATFPADSDNCKSLMQLSSLAKDYARRKGGNSFQYSSSDVNAIYNRRLSLQTKLRSALIREELVLYYQPIVNIRTGVIQGVEALLRWNSRESGLVPPNEFIPLAEETGLILPMGEWVLHKACIQLKEWHQAGRVPISISVNLSVRQFNDPEFFPIVKRIIHGSGIDPRFLKLEITETMLMEDIKYKIVLLKRLADLGIKLSIDDFGTGYSSLSYLSTLPVDELKIDRSFIRDVVVNSGNRAIVLSVIFLAHCLGLVTVAEGIETSEQLNFLKKEQCDQYQGFLFSRPVPEKELLRLLPPQVS